MACAEVRRVDVNRYERYGEAVQQFPHRPGEFAPAHREHHHLAGLGRDPDQAIRELNRVIAESPDPTAASAMLIVTLAGDGRLDEAEEYLTSDRKVDSPFVQTFEVLAELPNNDRELRRYFRHNGSRVPLPDC